MVGEAGPDGNKSLLHPFCDSSCTIIQQHLLARHEVATNWCNFGAAVAVFWLCSGRAGATVAVLRLLWLSCGWLLRLAAVAVLYIEEL